MKSRKSILFLIIFAVCTCAAGMLFGFGKTIQASANDSRDTVIQYLTDDGVSESNITQNNADGISISRQAASSGNIISFVKITINSWEEISNFQVKRMVLNTVQQVSNDDAGNEINTLSSEFLFYQSGNYIVEYEKSDTKKAIYSSYFEKEISLDAITVSNNAQLFANQSINNQNTNIIVLTGNGPISLSLDSSKIQSNLYNCVFDDGSNSITNNKTTSLTIKLASNSTTLEKIDFEVYCKFPTFVYKNSNGEVVPDVFSEIAEPDGTNGKLFFNEDVLVSPNFTGLDEEFLSKCFEFTTQKEGSEITSTYALNTSFLSSTNIIVKSETVEICKNPSSNIELRIGYNDSTAPIYPNLSTEEPIYAFGTLYAHAKNSTIAIDPNPTIVGDNLIVYGKLNGNVLFAYKFEYHDASAAKIEYNITTTPGKITINKPLIPVPVDLTIIDNSNQRFVYHDIFADVTGSSTTIEIKNAGEYRIIIAYTNVTENDTTITDFHKSFKYTVYGKSLIMTVNGERLFNGQTTNGTVTINSQETTSQTITPIKYTVTHNATNVGEFSDTQSFSDEGYYVVSNGTLTYEFSIISNDAKKAYTANSYKNATLVSYTADGQTVPTESTQTFNKNGTFTLNYELNYCIALEKDSKEEILEKIKEFSYSVKIITPNFRVVSNVGNGQRTANSVVINSIQASGNYTIQITHNKKTTTYTGTEFAKLTEKQRTFSNTGIYNILITDEAGNEFVYSFEKYYQANAILIILIVLLAAGVGIILFILIRLRLKAKVK